MTVRKPNAQSSVDPITRDVIQYRLEAIANAMESALIRSSLSVIVKESRDASTAIFNAAGLTVAQALAIPMHLGTLAVSVPAILESIPVKEMCEGDIFIFNDPYNGGTHLNDISMVKPVFFEGNVVALACAMAHMQDIGAMTPGVPAASTSIFQEGINIPPLKFYEKGQPNTSLLDIIRKNVRIPDIVLGDLGALVSAVNVGEVRFLEVIEEHGDEVILEAIAQLYDYAEELTRQQILAMPCGVYTFEDYMDNDGVDLDRRIGIRASVTIEESKMIVDFSHTDPQVKGPYNIPISGAYSVAAYVLRAIANSEIPTNAGFFRCVTVITPPKGSLVNPSTPAPVGARASTAERMVDTLFGALAQAIPDRVNAASGGEPLVVYFGGVDPETGREFVGNIGARSGLGARPTKDGIDVISTDVINGLNVPAEAHEEEFPVRVLRIGLHNDSGGAGKYRGGLGLHKILEVVRGENISFTYRGERHDTYPWGLFGGLPGANAKAYVLRRSGEKEQIPSKYEFAMGAGDQLHIFTAGGGGYGDPLDRDAELVYEDVLDHRVSVRAAQRDYGVVISPATLDLDLKATQIARTERRGSRGPINWIFDRGPYGKEALGKMSGPPVP